MNPFGGYINTIDAISYPDPHNYDMYHCSLHVLLSSTCATILTLFRTLLYLISILVFHIHDTTAPLIIIKVHFSIWLFVHIS